MHANHIPYNDLHIGHIELGSPTIATEMRCLGAAIEIDVTPDTFRNCFRRTGFTTEPIQPASPDQDGIIGELLAELANVPDAVPKGVSSEDFLSIDDDAAVIVSPSSALPVADVMEAGAAESTEET